MTHHIKPIACSDIFFGSTYWEDVIGELAPMALEYFGCLLYIEDLN